LWAYYEGMTKDQAVKTYFVNYGKKIAERSLKIFIENQKRMTGKTWQ